MFMPNYNGNASFNNINANTATITNVTFINENATNLTVYTTLCNSTGSCFSLTQLNASPDLSGYVPYVGATQDLDLATHNLKATNTTVQYVNSSVSNAFMRYDTDGNVIITLG
jgi:hypothetical protein